MSDLISRQAVIDLLRKWADGYCYIETPTDGAIKEIESLPTIDAVPVIRCKDCKYAYITNDGECKYCDIWFPVEAKYLDGDYYCASAERKES